MMNLLFYLYQAFYFLQAWSQRPIFIPAYHDVLDVYTFHYPSTNSQPQCALYSLTTSSGTTSTATLLKFPLLDVFSLSPRERTPNRFESCDSYTPYLLLLLFALTWICIRVWARCGDLPETSNYYYYNHTYYNYYSYPYMPPSVRRRNLLEQGVLGLALFPASDSEQEDEEEVGVEGEKKEQKQKMQKLKMGTPYAQTLVKTNKYAFVQKEAQAYVAQHYIYNKKEKCLQPRQPHPQPCYANAVQSNWRRQVQKIKHTLQTFFLVRIVETVAQLLSAQLLVPLCTWIYTKLLPALFQRSCRLIDMVINLWTHKGKAPQWYRMQDIWKRLLHKTSNTSASSSTNDPLLLLLRDEKQNVSNGNHQQHSSTARRLRIMWLRYSSIYLFHLGDGSSASARQEPREARTRRAQQQQQLQQCRSREDYQNNKNVMKGLPLRCCVHDGNPLLYDATLEMVPIAYST